MVGRRGPTTTSMTRGGGEEYFDRVEDEIEAREGRSPARCSNPDRTCVSHVDLGHTCDVSIVRLLRLRRRLGLSVLAGFLVAIPLTPLAFSVRAEWDPLRVVDRGFADGLHGMVTHRVLGRRGAEGDRNRLPSVGVPGGCTGTGSPIRSRGWSRARTD